MNILSTCYMQCAVLYEKQAEMFYYSLKIHNQIEDTEANVFCWKGQM